MLMRPRAYYVLLVIIRVLRDYRHALNVLLVDMPMLVDYQYAHNAMRDRYHKKRQARVRHA